MLTAGFTKLLHAAGTRSRDQARDDALGCADLRTAAMTNDATQISLAGSTLGETRHQRNAFCAPPQPLLPELRERRAKQVSGAAGI